MSQPSSFHAPRVNSSNAASSDSTRIAVRDLHKVFGTRHLAEAMRLARQGVGKPEIQKRTGCTVAIKGVSFEVRSQEIFVIMGLSGCGKSTVLRCLNRLIEPSAGEVLIDGQNIMRLSPPELRKLRREKLAMVFQNFGLLPHRSVLENVGFGLEIQRLPKRQRIEKAHQAISVVGLAAYADQPVQSLSGGMQQRVGLARALATDSEFLLMDEAFSALDPLIRTEMQDELLSLQKRMRKTIVFISHDLDEALRMGDRVGIMKDGQMIQVGPPAEILMHPRDDYVRQFVENVNRIKVLTAGAVAQPARATLPPDATVKSARRLMQEKSLETLFVVDPAQRFHGSVSRADIVDRRSDPDAALSGLLQGHALRAAPEVPLEQLLPLASRSDQPLAVVAGEETFLGLVTRTALLKAIGNTTAQPPDDEGLVEERGERT